MRNLNENEIAAVSGAGENSPSSTTTTRPPLYAGPITIVLPGGPPFEEIPKVPKDPT